MKQIKLISLIALAGFLVGCGTIKSTLTPALVQSSVAATTSFGLSRYPQAAPAVRIATEVICAAAAGTNVNPANIVAAIEASDWSKIKTPEATFIVQSGITAYTIVYNSWGAEAVNNSEQAVLFLGAVCNGLKAGTPAATFGAPRMRHINQAEWPHLQLP